MIEEILPEGSVVAEAAFEDEADAEPGLFPQEAALVARAVPQRRGEFATVRACARRALERLGIPPAPLLWARRGAPVWPAGIVGSMTHCTGFRGAAVARADDVAALGIDAEPNEPLPDGVLDVIALRAEARWLPDLARRNPTVCWDRVLFSAKESVFKTWFPLTQRELDFHQAEIRIGPPAPVPGALAGDFTARLLVPGCEVDGRRVSSFAGRWLVGRGLIVTGITVSRVPRPVSGTPRQQDVVRA